MFYIGIYIFLLLVYLLLYISITVTLSQFLDLPPASTHKDTYVRQVRTGYNAEKCQGEGRLPHLGRL